MQEGEHVTLLDTSRFYVCQVSAVTVQQWKC